MEREKIRMPTSQSEHSGRSGSLRCSDIFALSFSGCLLLVLYSLIPLLMIVAGLLTIKKGLFFWGIIIIVLGVLALVGPFYAASRAKDADDEQAEKMSDG